MKGLGDNILQRAVVRELIGRFDLYLETPWPQLVADLPIKCVRSKTRLRTQEKNAARGDLIWHEPPRIASKAVHYVGHQGTMLAGLCASLGINPARITFDLPAFLQRPGTQPYVVIRPATLRKEWLAAARNPLPEYLALAAEKLRERFHIISVADLAPGVEWPLLPLPYADETYHAGELAVEELLALVQGAAGCVGGVGWLAPACVAYRTPLFLIYGGNGQHDGPLRIFDRRMPTGNVHHAVPDRFCMCANRSHACDKRISRIEQQLDAWAVGLGAGFAAPVAA